MSKNRREHTEKKSFDPLGWTDYYETKVWDQEGNEGKGIDWEKGNPYARHTRTTGNGKGRGKNG